jgi:hypothetical protein
MNDDDYSFLPDVLRLRDILINNKIEEVNKNNDHKKNAYLEGLEICELKGLEICKKLESVADFESVLVLRRECEHNARQSPIKPDFNNCALYNHTTNTIEYIYEHMKVIVGSNGMNGTQSVYAKIAKINVKNLLRTDRKI